MEMNIAIKALTALAHETRLTIFRLLVQAGESGVSAGQLAKELSNADLVSARQESRFIYYSANFETMNGLLGYLIENCCAGIPCSPVEVCCDEKNN